MSRKLGSLLYVILAVILAGCCGSTAVTKSTVRERPDSLSVTFEPVAITDAKSDSVEFTPADHEDTTAFTGIRAKLDTTLQGVGISAKYQYPPDAWTIGITRKDTLVRWMVRDSLIERPYEVEVVPLWVKLVLVLACVAVLGMVVALVKR